MSAHPFNSQKIIDSELILEGYEEALVRLEILKEKLFPAIPAGKPIEDAKPAFKGKSKAKTEQGKARAAAAGLAVE